jgi:hypothetical protein
MLSIYFSFLPNLRIATNLQAVTQDLNHIARYVASKFIIQTVAQNSEP